MKFYYQNSIGDCGVFKEVSLVKAIYTAWNIEANLYLINKNFKGKLTHDNVFQNSELVFAPWESNEFNSEILKKDLCNIIDGLEV